MSRIVKINELLGEMDGLIDGNMGGNAGELAPFKSEDIEAAIRGQLDQFDMEEIEILKVEVGLDGHIFVSFGDQDGDVMDVVFGYDEEFDDGAFAIILGETEDDMGSGEDDILMLDLEALDPVLSKSPLGTYVNLTATQWMSKSFFSALFMAGDIDWEEDREGAPVKIPGVWEAFKTVVRGGKKVRLALVRRKRRKVLSAAQKAGIRKGVAARKRHAGAINRKRKKSLAIKKRLGIKSAGTPQGFKVSGSGS